MSDNIFFHKSELKECGKNVIIGKTVRIRYPELVSIADNVIIDDFTYISTALVISDYVHISAGLQNNWWSRRLSFIWFFFNAGTECGLSSWL